MKKKTQNLLLPDMIMKVLLMCQQHLAKINRIHVRRRRDRKRQGNTNESICKVREQKRKNRQMCRSNNSNNKDLL